MSSVNELRNLEISMEVNYVQMMMVEKDDHNGLFINEVVAQER